MDLGRTALHYAAVDADLDAVRRLLGTEDVKARDNHDWTPLHFAAQAGAPELVALLLDAGAEIDAVTDKGMPEIYWAIMFSGADPIATVRLLRARGADPTKATMKSYFGPRSPLDTVKEIMGRPASKHDLASDLRRRTGTAETGRWANMSAKLLSEFR
ncbi:ankyrin repeat domain-containing protein [Nocardia pseudovaccinii]|uniref:ankyrin repeat domain-containing protein n=1 Tax=Nocardia pseudovaccinii TaxID=189540 RepID=UPI0007A387A5|nr:ankyrin repeat domain-containing protein [Nocardia pseudovaccinii]